MGLPVVDFEVVPTLAAVDLMAMVELLKQEVLVTVAMTLERVSVWVMVLVEVMVVVRREDGELVED